MKTMYSVLASFIEININISIWTVTTFSLLGLFIYYLKHPEKFEKLIAVLSKGLKFVSNKFDYSYIKYDLQGKINDYLKTVSKKVKHLDVEKISIRWILPKETNVKTFLENGSLILCMKKSENQNANIVNASMAFISHAFLKKAKYYIAKYQRESLDLYACYDLLRNEKSEILDQFVQDFMKDKLNNTTIGEFFEKYVDIDKGGIFYPVLVQELTFLGEKVFSKNRESQIIYSEVKDLVEYLYAYAHRKLREETISDFNGAYCKFAIRIIGKRFKVSALGEETYTKNLKKICSDNETIYIIGNVGYKSFLQSVIKKCEDEIGYDLLTEETYEAIIKDENGNDYKVKNYMIILRNRKIQVYHKVNT
jgi:hypothetical protein